MIFRNSFTSNSDYWRYLFAALVTCVGVVAVVMSLSFVAIRHHWMRWHFGDLWEYQIAKLHKPGKIDILLVGDSSLGNGVNARQWSRALNKNVVSLALTGVYGIGGSLNMIRRAARHHKIGAIIVMQTVDMMERTPNREGDLFTAERLSDISGLTPFDLIRALANWDILSRSIVRVVKSSEAAAIQKFDYVPQVTPLPQTTQVVPHLSADIAHINQENLVLVRKIAEKCHSLHIACFYANGPILDTFCQSSNSYMTHVLNLVRAAGLKPIRTSICLPWPDVGDSTDHVAPARKIYYSSAMLKIIRPYLEDAGIVPASPR